MFSSSTKLPESSPALLRDAGLDAVTLHRRNAQYAMLASWRG
nr:hypothetical protein [Variovorax boronicumulans]